jgi:hypothetical protein
MPDENGYWTDSDRDAVIQPILQQLEALHQQNQAYISQLLTALEQDPRYQAAQRQQAWAAILGAAIGGRPRRSPATAAIALPARRGRSATARPRQLLPQCGRDEVHDRGLAFHTVQLEVAV